MRSVIGPRYEKFWRQNANPRPISVIRLSATTRPPYTLYSAAQQRRRVSDIPIPLAPAWERSVSPSHHVIRMPTYE